MIIGLVVLSGTIVMLNFRYERQFSASLEQEVNRQKEKLQKSEARYQGLVENAADLIYTVDDTAASSPSTATPPTSFAMARSPQGRTRRRRRSRAHPRTSSAAPFTTSLPKNPPTSTWTGCGR